MRRLLQWPSVKNTRDIYEEKSIGHNELYMGLNERKGLRYASGISLFLFVSQTRTDFLYNSRPI